MHTDTWRAEIFVFERDGRTHARAVVHTPAGAVIEHTGDARRNPSDRDVPEIGEELAVCRALSGVAHDLLSATVDDVEQNTGNEASLSI